MRMRTLVSVVMIVMAAVAGHAQEKPVPSDSVRLTVTGCARRSVFVVQWRTDHESIAGEIAEGRRFRLTGRKDVLKDVRAREGSMVALTGLVRKNALNPQNGVAVGRVRIGLGSPQQPISDPARNPEMYQPVFDVESYQLLPEPCSLK
jgi:hypothetical protein